MGDLHLVHPALNLSVLDAGIMIMVQQVSLMMFSLNMVDYPMSFLLLSRWNFFWWTSTSDLSKMFWSNLVSVQGPLVLDLGLKGLGPGLDN